MSFVYWVHFAFSIYTIFLFARILSSWIPNGQSLALVRFIAFYTDPYLNIFRQILPPLGGQIDISPILAFFVLKIIESALLGLLS